ncbi:MAG: hypothetical protein HYU66_15175 [Armatimonadetes bacterium]|nr:hypothetical protein [Armatimonadota bacterium]
MADSMAPRTADPERDELLREFQAAMRRLYPAAQQAGRSVATCLHQMIHLHADAHTLRAILPDLQRLTEKWLAEGDDGA